jgi:hypothetical protein
MKRTGLYMLIVMALIVFAQTAVADGLDEGRNLMRQGKLEQAAQFFNDYAKAHPRDKKLTPEALAMAGRILDVLADSLTGRAEKTCYWKKGAARNPDCMQKQAEALNEKYGKGAFEYEHAVTFIPYTGFHYREILSRYPRSRYAIEAHFYVLLKNLKGHPDQVLPRIREFAKKYGKGEWKRRAQLLWARVNEDVWYVHREWSWVLFNEVVDQEELIIRAEPYRQEALRTYEKIAGGKDAIGRMAAIEYAKLKENQDDGHLYGIVNDSSPKTLSVWGVDAPSPPSSD